MLDTLQQQSFLVGAALVAIYQATKFSQLNVGDPVTSRYIALLPGAKVRDFAGPYAYHITLAMFLGVSLVAYFLCCHISPDIIAGAAIVFGAPEAPAVMKDVPYPLYIAALFMGLTQPVIPVLSKIGDAQRDFFHDRMAVPRRVIDLSESLTNAIEARSGTSKRRLATELRKLTSGDFLISLQNDGDVLFYKQQLAELEIDDEVSIARVVKESSLKDLRGLIERLVLSALVAVMRRSGPKSLIRVAESLGAPHSPTRGHQVRFLLASFIASGVLFSVGLLIIANVFWFLAEPVARLFGKTVEQSLWPSDLYNVGLELWAIVPPILICLVMAISLLVPKEQPPLRRSAYSAEPSRLLALVEFFRSSAGVLGLCIVVSVLIKIGQLFYEYNSFNLPPEARSASRLILPVIQSFIPVAVCLFTTWYLASGARRVRGLSFAATLLAIAAVTGSIAALYSLAFVTEYLNAHRDLGHAWEYVLFGVVANSLICGCAFASVALFFKTRQDLPEAVRARSERRRGTSRRETGRAAHALGNIYSQVHARLRPRRAAAR